VDFGKTKLLLELFIFPVKLGKKFTEQEE